MVKHPRGNYEVQGSPDVGYRIPLGLLRHLCPILIDGEGELSRFYQGVADFFLQKVISVKELSVEKNEEKSLYFGATAEEVEGASSIFSAPPRGVLVFEDIRRNDVIGVLFQVDGGSAK